MINKIIHQLAYIHIYAMIAWNRNLLLLS